MKLSVTIWLSLAGVACSSSPDVKIVEKIVEVPVNTPPQLMQPCDIPTRDGERVRDYIVSERRLRNALVFCNTLIEIRNRNEALSK